MKGSRIVAVLFCATMLTLSIGCGGGGDGGGGTTPLATGAFTKVITPTGGISSVQVFNNTPDPGSDYRVQSLYTADTISASGMITGLSLMYNETVSSAVTCTTVTIKLGHTLVSTLSTTFADNQSNGSGGPTTVLSNATVEIPPGSAGEWFTIPFTTPFAYNGAENVVVEIERSAFCSSSFQLRVDATRPSGASVMTTYGLPTGFLQVWAPVAKLHFSGGDDRIDYPSFTADVAPFGTTATWNHIQMLHLANDLAGSGPITGIGIISAATPTTIAEAVYTVNVKLAHTVASALTATFADNYTLEAPKTVASNATFVVPAGIPAGTPVWLPITGSFIYNGTDNLIVEIEVLSANRNTSWRKDATHLPNSRVYGAVGAASGTLNGGSYHTVFRFNGATMDVITQENSLSFFLGTSAISQQVLYTASELGTNGSISRIACRASFDNSPLSYANTRVVMRNTLISDLSATYADNIAGGTTVFAGTLDVPAVKAGDWIEIPLSTSFAYDGTSNLVIQLSSDGGPTNYWCRAGADPTRWAKRYLQEGNGFTPIVYDMRFWLKK